jgi:hypothetical protein
MQHDENPVVAGYQRDHLMFITNHCMVQSSLETRYSITGDLNPWITVSGSIASFAI